MSTNVRWSGVVLLSALLVAAQALSASAAPRGGRGRSGGGPGVGGPGSNGGSGGGGFHGGMSAPKINLGGSGVGAAGGAGGSGLKAFHGPGVGAVGDHPALSPKVDFHGKPPVAKHGPDYADRAGAWHDGRGYAHGDWSPHQDWWRHNGPNWVGWWQVGLGWPVYAAGWWPRYYGGYGYAYYDAAPYYGDVYVDYNVETVPYTAAYAADEAVAAQPTAYDGMMDFYPMALEAFQAGDYRNATRLAAHASIDDPQNADVHLLLTLGLFALGEYRGAANEAHVALALGKMPDWAKVFGIYGNVEPYTKQLRALEKYVSKNPNAAEGRFLLGMLYLMADHKATAGDELLKALKLTPKDRLAAQLLTEAGGTVPEDIAKQLESEPPPAPPAPQEPDE